ncbi:hypothetical protein FSP39_002899 [Pinctada imbricata]|uniref:Uncharacterized protein n=1 Tax=Pinctada imbricata TaxID=66713 RepID=A0AA89BHL0_PINIB|nr:hypothetical protein FSP39_002899 [Pinctada imbricata]
MYNNKTYSPEEVQSRLKEIRGNLKINRKNTTVYKRSLLSATDERISAQSIGYVGVAVLIIISGLIISMDVPRVITWMREFIKNRRDKT